MKHSFPVRRDNTITRRNIEALEKQRQEEAAKDRKDCKPLSAENLAAHFCGGVNLVQLRHVWRCRKLMVPRKG